MAVPEPTASASGDTAPAAPDTHRRRPLLIWTLIVVATLIMFGSIVTTWVHRQMLDTQSWKDASAQLIEDPQIRSAVSVYVVDQLYDNVDVGGELAARLPDNLKPLAGTVAGALREPATKAVNRLLDGPRFQQLWINANAVAHEKLVNVLEDKTGNGISTGDGVVTLDLGELVTALGTQVGVPASTLDKIPPNTGVITVMKSDQLAAAQTAVKTVKVLSTALLVLVLALYALAIYLAHGHRRETLRAIAVAFILVGLAVLVLRRVAGNVAVDALTQPRGEVAGQKAWLIGSEILGEIGWATILYGVIGLAGAILAGPTNAATSFRRRIAPVLNERPAIAAGVVSVVFLLLILWGGTHALRTVWGIVLLGALLALGVVAFRRLTIVEFPAAAPAPAPQEV